MDHMIHYRTGGKT